MNFKNRKYKKVSYNPKFKILTLVLFLLLPVIAFSGCATTAGNGTSASGLSSGNVALSTKMSSSIFLQPVPSQDKIVYVSVRNTSTAIGLNFKNELISELKKATENGPEITVYDERFSSVQAQKSLIEQNIKRKKKKEKIDSVASSFILQSYLDRQKQRKEIF